MLVFPDALIRSLFEHFEVAWHRAPKRNSKTSLVKSGAEHCNFRESHERFPHKQRRQPKSPLLQFPV